MNRTTLAKRQWRIAAFAFVFGKAASVLAVVFRFAGPHASNPAMRGLYYAGIVSPTLICLLLYLDARQNALPARAQNFWAAMSVVVPVFTTSVYAGHILRHVIL